MPRAMHILIILDRSGSMEAIRQETIDGFNSFLEKVKTEHDGATLTLIQFDSEDPFEVVHRMKPVQEVPALNEETFRPRACTPLLDAIGQALQDLDATLCEIPEGDRPAGVMIAILTDGFENDSTRFTRDQIRELIDVRRKQRGWEFLFLSCDENAIQEAPSLNIDVSNITPFDRSGDGTKQAWKSLYYSYIKIKSRYLNGFLEESPDSDMTAEEGPLDFVTSASKSPSRGVKASSTTRSPTRRGRSTPRSKK